MLSKKEQIIETAFQLFNTNGFYATGVDLIMQTANISKRTMYKYFPTKNHLIIAALEYYRQTYQRNLSELLEQQDLSPKEKVLKLFAQVQNWSTDQTFHGCLAVNAMGEFDGKDEGIEQSCQKFKAWQLDMLNALCEQMDSQHPEQLAYKLFILMEGIASISQVNKHAIPIDVVELAANFIDEAVSS